MSKSARLVRTDVEMKSAAAPKAETWKCWKNGDGDLSSRLKTDQGPPDLQIALFTLQPLNRLVAC
jgi:hypothetical protein